MLTLYISAMLKLLFLSLGDILCCDYAEFKSKNHLVSVRKSLCFYLKYLFLSQQTWLEIVLRFRKSWSQNPAKKWVTPQSKRCNGVKSAQFTSEMWWSKGKDQKMEIHQSISTSKMYLAILFAEKCLHMKVFHLFIHPHMGTQEK